MNVSGFTGNAAVKLTTCGTKKMLGGYRVAGKGHFYRKSVNLPSHKRLAIRLTAYMIDSWDNEYYIVKANGV